MSWIRPAIPNRGLEIAAWRCLAAAAAVGAAAQASSSGSRSSGRLRHFPQAPRRQPLWSLAAPKLAGPALCCSAQPFSSAAGARGALPAESEHKAPLLVVLDLDETLVHTSVGGPYDFRVGRFGELHVQKRPGVHNFLSWLQTLQPHVEVVVYTASVESYADAVLSHLDPDRTLVKRRLCRQDCVASPVEDMLSKDLRKFGYDLSRVVLVDNNPICHGLQPHNGILVQDFLGTGNLEEADSELERVRGVLERLLEVSDVREVLRESRLDKLVAEIVRLYGNPAKQVACVECGTADAVQATLGAGLAASNWFCTSCQQMNSAATGPSAAAAA